jgi:hypothetical protein
MDNAHEDSREAQGLQAPPVLHDVAGKGPFAQREGKDQSHNEYIILSIINTFPNIMEVNQGVPPQNGKRNFFPIEYAPYYHYNEFTMMLHRRA